MYIPKGKQKNNESLMCYKNVMIKILTPKWMVEKAELDCNKIYLSAITDKINEVIECFM